MELTPDTRVVLELAGLPINATIVNTWIVMAVLVAISWLATRNLDVGSSPGRWRNGLEVLVLWIEEQIRGVTSTAVRQVMSLAGSLFLFIASANLLAVVPGFRSPTGSLSTTVALTLAVLLAVPLFGIAHGGLRHYLGGFFRPSVFMLPFNLLGELSRGVSLSVRLYGNVMSGAVIAAILLTIAPFFFPVIMDLFGLLIGLIQAYIFAILATVYVSSAMADPDVVTPQEDRA